jgi:glutamate 5-kinase
MKPGMRVVIKLGTSTLTKSTRSLSRPNFLECVRQVAQLHEEGIQVLIVSSGAVAAGMEAMNHPKVSRTLPSKQMFSSVGQGKLINVWSEIFGMYGIGVGQILLTRGDFSDRRCYLNIRDTMNSLLEHRIVPIINENDTVATEEIKVGDNDNLAAMVCNLIGANLLIIITDQKGLYDRNPRQYSDAKLIEQIDYVDDNLLNMPRSASELGTGGMATKMTAAQIASQSGTPTVITSFDEKDVILRVAKGEKLGTLFPSHTTPKESRKRWLLSEKPAGGIVIDGGAEERIKGQGASLLPVGITAVKGEFGRGAVVNVHSKEKVLVAVGMSNYSSDEIAKLKGEKSDRIDEILGYSYGNEVVHRDNMAIAKSK